jgi:hypothetical protein
MAKSEIIPGEHKVSEDDGESGEDKQAQETKDVSPDYRSLLDGERMPDLR